MPIVDLRRVLGLVLVSMIVAACSGVATPAPEASTYPRDLAGVVSTSNLADAGVVSLVVPSNARAAAIPAVAAVEAAEADSRTEGGPDRGPVIAVARALAGPPPVETVWVVVFGPGGTVPVIGPDASATGAIVSQIVLIDDQNGTYLHNTVASR